jgi:hypothetical protein
MLLSYGDRDPSGRLALPTTRIGIGRTASVLRGEADPSSRLYDVAPDTGIEPVVTGWPVVLAAGRAGGSTLSGANCVARQ